MKPRINFGPADKYSNSNERIAEVSGKNGVGFLMSVIVADDGTLRVDIYRISEGVTINVSEQREKL